ncbi:hypothetical protein B0T17DRAFT_183051 [Bombardia bombarda]|uniref:Uncharacterized protein n=1 Tax=Bombardia bombarda TaxID=252184 RepID=A0AA39X8N6_9PEZI|nr:hypothetical protein B0T17DRAFT_183051 [Bombardia bombarda]
MESAPPAQQPALSAATSGGTAGSQNAGPGGLSHPEPQIQHRANPESASGQAQTPTARPVFKMKRTGLSGAYPFAALGASRLSSSSVSKPPTISGSPSLLLRPSTDPPNKATTTATKDATPTSQANGTPSLSRNSLPQLRQTEEEKSRFLAPVRPVPNRTSVVSNTSAQGDDASARSSVRNSFFNDTRNGKNNSDDGNEDSDVGMADANCVRSALENRRASIRKLESTNHSASIDQQPYKTVKG